VGLDWREPAGLLVRMTMTSAACPMSETIMENALAVLDVALPDAGFYLWAGVPSHLYGGSDVEFAKALLGQCNVQVLPGSLLAREAQGVNPGAGRVRMALVAEAAQCTEAAHRIRRFIQGQS